MIPSADWLERYDGLFAANGYDAGPWHIYAEFVPLLPRSGSVLELGCGNGLLLRYLMDHTRANLDVYGVEHRPASIAQARTLVFPRRAQNFVVGNLRRAIPFNRSFTTILVNPVHADPGYDHQRDGRLTGLRLDGSVERLVRRCWRRLEPGGRLILWSYRGQLEEVADQRAALLVALACGQRVPDTVVRPDLTLWTHDKHR